MDEVEHAAGVAVEAELGAVVPDAADDLAGDVLDVDVGSVRISPATITVPVVTKVSQAQRTFSSFAGVPLGAI